VNIEYEPQATRWTPKRSQSTSYTTNRRPGYGRTAPISGGTVEIRVRCALTTVPRLAARAKTRAQRSSPSQRIAFHQLVLAIWSA